MSQPELEPKPVKFATTLTDASNLPIYHVNILNVRNGVDEFFITLGVAPPPDATELAAIMESGTVVGQPIFRFAISRDTMEQFLAVLAGQYDQQTEFIKRLHEESNKEEVSRNE